MLKNSLPEIVTETLPGPKAEALIKRRAEATPKAIGCVYPVAIARGEGAMIEDVDGNSAHVGQNFSNEMDPKLETISQTTENRPLPTLGRSSDFKMYPSWAPFLKV